MFEKPKHTISAAASDKIAAEFFQNCDYRSALQQNFITESIIGRPTAETLKNSSSCYSFLLDIDNAIAKQKAFVDNFAHSPQDLSTLVNLYCQRGDYQQAYQINQQQIECDLKYIDDSGYLFHKGQYESAFAALEIGKKLGNLLYIGEGKYPNLPQCARWNGEDIDGKKIVVVSEGGLGDEIIFSRWLQHLDAEVYYYTESSLFDVFARNFGVKKYNPRDSYDYWFPSMSLPTVTGCYTPGKTVYLHPDQKYVDKWKNILGTTPFICVNWKGSDTFTQKHFRNIPVELFQQTFGTEYKLINVCKEAKECPDSIQDVTTELACWEDTLAVLSLCDAVISCDSSVPHAASALGKTTQVFVRPDPYFPWSEGTGTPHHSTWYSDATTVWRTSAIGKWDKLIPQAFEFYQTGKNQ